MRIAWLARQAASIAHDSVADNNYLHDLNHVLSMRRTKLRKILLATELRLQALYSFFEPLHLHLQFAIPRPRPQARCAHTRGCALLSVQLKHTLA